MRKTISEAKVVVATHSYVYSASQALRDYLRKKDASVLYISHPLQLKASERNETSFYEYSKGQRIKKKTKLNYKSSNLLISTFIEILFSLSAVYKTKVKFDLFVGVDNLNALQGLLLKLLGKVDKVVFYTIDYFPTRFENRYLNAVYHFIDRICVYFSDETWNVSSKMIDAREKHHGMMREKYNRQYEVPIGIWFDKRKIKDFGKIDKTKLIFVGHLVAHMGVDLLIKSLPLIRKKNRKVSLDIVGGGEEYESLIKLAKKMKVNDVVKFYGWILDRKKLEKIMSRGALGMATFNTRILDDKVKNADPGKIKDYMQVGMPVVFTNAISTGKRIVANKAGFLVKYSEKDLSETVVDVLGSTKILKEYRLNAIEYIKKFDYAKIFRLNLLRVLN